jgi:hypothetical protein
MSAAIGTALLVGLLLVAVMGVAASPPQQDDLVILEQPKLTAPYVSKPVMPVDTRGLPLAAAPSTQPDEPQEMAYARRIDRAQRDMGMPRDGDPVVQRAPGMAEMPTPDMNFEGISWNGVLPPDTDGQVGPDHYVQIVNAPGSGAHVRIWSKETGAQLHDFGLGNLWPGDDLCYQYPYGDPVVLYDQLADRWLLTQFALPDPPYYECIAVSKTGVPTANPNDWYLYSFKVHDTKLNDYPKLGVWPDGYYMSANQFTATWGGVGVWVFDREKMLNGQAASFQYFDVYDLDPDYFGLLPSNLMGDTLPPDGAPNYFASVDMNWSGSDDVLHIFEFHTDWDNPSNSSFGLATDLMVAPFDWNFLGIGGPRGNWDIPQPMTFVELDSISDRLMMHLWYRNFGGHESLVVNHTVNVGSAFDQAGVRWYEIRGGTVNTTLADASIYQQGTYAPDNENRWMGSVAMDSAGNMALGYSISSSSVYPSIRYTGRLAEDPLGTLPQGEEQIIGGTGYQSHTEARWGDYSAMSVDPVDDCTFWYTQEYIEISGVANWQTRVASFEFPDCGPPDPARLYPIANPGGEHDYEVSWSAPPGATGYILQEDSSYDFSSALQLYDGPALAYDVVGREGGTWYYRVLAYNSFGSIDWSNTRKVIVRPYAPTLSAIANGGNADEYTVQWSAPSGASSYILEEDDSAAFSSPTTRFVGSATQYDVTGQPGGTWLYRVLAQNAAGVSLWSDAESTTVDPPGLDSPLLLSIDNADKDDQYMVDWGEVSGATSYSLEESGSPYFEAPTVVFSGSSTEHQVTGQPGGTWYYRARAFGTGERGPWSNTQSALVPFWNYLPMVTK